MKNPVYVDKFVLLNGGVIEREDGTDIIAINAAGTTTTVTGTETVIASEVTLAANNLLQGSSTGVGEAVTDITLPKEGARTVTIATTTTAATAGGALTVKAATGATTGAGGAVSVAGGASGVGATGNGGAANVTGGAAASTNGNGGDVVLTGGAKTGSGVAGNTMSRSPIFGRKQGAQTAKTTSATLTAAEVLAKIITVNQGGAGVSAQQLPTCADLDTALPGFTTDDSFDFSVINISVVDAEDASVTTNTGWTLVGNMDVHAYSAAGSLNSSAMFRARKTGAATWTLYRVA